MRTETYAILELDVPSIATRKKIRPYHRLAGGAGARLQSNRRTISRQPELGQRLLGLTAGSCCDRSDSDIASNAQITSRICRLACSCRDISAGVFSYSSVRHRGIR